MNAGPFYVFFGIFGLMVGALVVWFVMSEHPFESAEVPGGPVDDAEAALLVKMLADEGQQVDENAVARLLQLHGQYVDGRIREALEAQERAKLEAERGREGTGAPEG
jgi:hypothetical protein